MEWSTEIPNRAGYYWFVGQPYDGGNIENELHLISIKQAPKSLIFIVCGHFMENKKGLWQEAVLPDNIPEGTKINYI